MLSQHAPSTGACAMHAGAGQAALHYLLMHGSLQTSGQAASVLIAVIAWRSVAARTPMTAAV